MAITPQAIKDQEFQSKFRGYDTIEVKAYLELIAEEFFEQLEEVRSQSDTIEALEEEKEDLVNEKKLLKERIGTIQQEAETKIAAYSNKDDAIIILEKELEDLKKKIELQEEEKATKDVEILSIKEMVHKKDLYIQKLSTEKAELEKQIKEQSKQIESLDAVEVDFKSTLIMAQKFSTDIKEKSEAEAQEIIDLAIEEAEKQRQETFAELARYPKEIERLKEKRNKVRDELAAILQSTLDSLDVFDPQPADDDEDELFQTISLPLVNDDRPVFDNLGVDFSAPQRGDSDDLTAESQASES
jgi:DivIVA domain-containing protein